jgi:hypothetical protein
MPYRVFGIRHHGPGCSRSLLTALEAMSPDCVLIEGPPDAEEILPLCIHAEMKPPVALFVYPPHQPGQAVFYPFSHFSPEWQALRYGLGRSTPVRFMDLPQTHWLALEPATAESHDVKEEQSPPADEAAADNTQIREDPIGALAQAAGFTDRELWWEIQVEQRRDSQGLFDSIAEAMIALRKDVPCEEDRITLLREAFMRKTIRTALKEGFTNIAVVCGAWHLPALVEMPSQKADQELLSGLPKVPVNAAWTPWTNDRLSSRSGYGAGVVAPGWYAHLWSHPVDAPLHWIIEAARLLRSEDLDASSASVIEAVRLSQTLAALRELPMPGLCELTEAIQCVLCAGSATPLALIRDRLEIGAAMGQIPSEAPATALQCDLEALQRRLRLKPSNEIKPLDLDLREETDRMRSCLLHRLNLIQIPWGQLQKVSSKTGTFHELWQLQWKVEFAIPLVQASAWGSSIELAAVAHARQAADSAAALPALSDLLQQAVYADLTEAVSHVLHRISDMSAVCADVRHMMEALPSLAQIARYGDVRGTSSEMVSPIIGGLFERVLIGLPGACNSLDDDAARTMLAATEAVEKSIEIINDTDMAQRWHAVLLRLKENPTIHGMVRGRCLRIVMIKAAIGDEELLRSMRLALSPAVSAPEAAAWIEGLVAGGGLLLVHQQCLWQTLNAWLHSLTEENFTALLPILRRAFADFQPPERRALGEKVQAIIHGAQDAGPSLAAVSTDTVAIDPERARLVLPVLATILGVAINDHL